jgi:hypothetical protein
MNIEELSKLVVECEFLERTDLLGGAKFSTDIKKAKQELKHIKLSQSEFSRKNKGVS